MSEALRHAIRDGQMIAAARREAAKWVSPYSAARSAAQRAWDDRPHAYGACPGPLECPMCAEARESPGFDG